MDEKVEHVFAPLRQQRLAEEVLRQVKGAILDGHYRPGDRLPPERALCESFGVGRSVVREALRSLQDSGLICVRQGAGGGAFVQRMDASTLTRTFEGFVKMDKVSLEELTEARLALEMGALPLVVKRLEPEDLAKLRANLAEARESLERKLRGKKNLDFHVLLVKASRNPLLSHIAEALYGLMGELIDPYEYSDERSRRALTIHARLIELLETKQFDEAASLLEEHIRGSATVFSNRPGPAREPSLQEGEGSDAAGP